MLIGKGILEGVVGKFRMETVEACVRGAKVQKKVQKKKKTKNEAVGNPFGFWPGMTRM